MGSSRPTSTSSELDTVAEPIVLAAIPQTRTHAISLISLTSAALASWAAQASYGAPGECEYLGAEVT